MKSITKYILTFGLAVALSSQTKAQLNPMKSQYFQNPYLVNAAMAGYQNKAEVFLNYSNQWNKIDGAPVLLSYSAMQPVNDKAAVGLNVINDKSGLMRKTQVAGSFAYKVPFSAEHHIRFGVSLSWSQDRLDYAMATSSGVNDAQLA